MSSPSSRRGTIDLSIRKLSLSSKPDIYISLRGSEDPFPQSFSTLDKIEGTVSIAPHVDTTVEDLEIAFLGKHLQFRLVVDLRSPFRSLIQDSSRNQKSFCPNISLTAT